VEALRTYVVRVLGMISKQDPRKTEIALQLLSPIETSRPAAARSKVAEAPTPAAAPGMAEPSRVDSGAEPDAP
jgi:hypothetical protein